MEEVKYTAEDLARFSGATLEEVRQWERETSHVRSPRDIQVDNMLNKFMDKYPRLRDMWFEGSEITPLDTAWSKVYGCVMRKGSADDVRALATIFLDMADKQEKAIQQEYDHAIDVWEDVSSSADCANEWVTAKVLKQIVGVMIEGECPSLAELAKSLLLVDENYKMKKDQDYIMQRTNPDGTYETLFNLKYLADWKESAIDYLVEKSR